MNQQTLTKMKTPSITFTAQENSKRNRVLHSPEKRKQLIIQLLINLYQKRNINITNTEMNQLARKFNLNNAIGYQLDFAGIVKYDSYDRVYRWIKDLQTPIDWSSLADHCIEKGREYQRKAEMITKAKKAMIASSVDNSSENKLDIIISQLQTISKALGLA